MPLIVMTGGREKAPEGNNYKIKIIDQTAENNEITLAYYSEGVNKIHYVSVMVTEDVIDDSGIFVAYCTNMDINLSQSASTAVSSEEALLLMSDSAGVQADTSKLIAFPDRFAVYGSNGFHYSGFIIYS